MTSLKPYMIRAIYDWIVDNNLTPHLLVATEDTDAVVPEAVIEDGKIILNVRPEAVQHLSMGNDKVEFSACFSGKSMNLIIPIPAILAIYAKEDGKGMVFNEEEDPSHALESKTPIKPELHIVK